MLERAGEALRLALRRAAVVAVEIRDRRVTEAIAMTTTTTSTSISVKPALPRRRHHRSHEPMSASMPVPPGWPSAPKLKTSISPCRPGFRYWYGLAPRILGQPIEITVGLPVGRQRRQRRPRRQRGESLLGGGVALIVEAIELERGEDRRDVAPRGDDARLVGSLEHARHDERRENPEDHDDDEHFDQREAGRAAS